MPGAGDEASIQLPGTVTTDGEETIDTLILGADATLNVGNFTILGVPDPDNAAGRSVISGTLAVEDNAFARIAGTVDNTGTLSLDGTYYGDRLLVGDASNPGLTLTGGGVLALTDFADNSINGNVSNAVLDNVDNTIEGSGNLGNADLSIMNAGTIDATGTAASLVVQASSVTNTGLIEATGTAGLKILDSVANTGGTIGAFGGEVELESGADIIGGTLISTSGGLITLEGAVLDGATNGAITLQGEAVIVDNDFGTAFGTLDNTGTLSLDGTYYGAGLLVGDASNPGLTLTGGGVLVLTDFADNSINGNVSNAVLDNVDNTIEGSGNLGNADLSIMNAGTIDAIGTAASLVVQASSVTNTGLIEATGTAGLKILDSVANTGGTIGAFGGEIELESSADIIGGTLISTSGGLITLEGAVLDGATSGAITLQGEAVIVDNDVGTAFGTLDNTGTLSLDGTYYGDGLLVGDASNPELTLTGGGVLVLTDFADNSINGNVSSAVLDNVDNTIEGSGKLGNADLSIMNAGTIDATGTAASLVVAGPALANSGLIEAVGSAGLLIQSGTVTNTGTLLAVGTGALTVDAPIIGIGTITIDANATTALEGSVSAGQTISFAGASTLRLTTPTTFNGQLAGLSAGVKIDLLGHTITDASLAAGSLDLTGDFGSVDYGVLGAIAGDSVSIQSDGAGGDEVVIATSTNAPCFCRGTRILTEHGECAVENLSIGDLVRVAGGGAEQIIWIGSRMLDCRRHAEPHKVQPVCIRAGAFGPDLPKRDLFLSPDHAIFMEDVLIPVRHLVNGISVIQCDFATTSYFHVELARHSVILAEDLPVESYLDTGDRSSFDNSDGVTQLHPAWGSYSPDVAMAFEALGYAPLRVEGPELDRIRLRLEERLTATLGQAVA